MFVGQKCSGFDLRSKDQNMFVMDGVCEKLDQILAKYKHYTHRALFVNNPELYAFPPMKHPG